MRVQKCTSVLSLNKKDGNIIKNRALLIDLYHNEKVMRVKISWKKILLMWLGVFFLLAPVISLMFFNLFYLTKWDYRQIIIISVYVVVMVVILILSINTQYYEINKKDITECKYGKKYTYFYSDIIYVDIENSKRSKTLTFVTKYGHVKYLTFDKEGKIFDAVINRCKNLITLQEVKTKFPGIKI